MRTRILPSELPLSVVSRRRVVWALKARCYLLKHRPLITSLPQSVANGADGGSSEGSVRVRTRQIVTRIVCCEVSNRVSNQERRARLT